MSSFNYNNPFQQSLQDLSRQYQNLTTAQQNMFQNQVPYTTFPVQAPALARQVQYVEGINGAKLYQDNMQPNCSEIIMDKDDNIFYYVSKDANGTPAKKIVVGRFTIEEQQDETQNYLTKKDFEDFKQEIRNLLSAPAAKSIKEDKK